MDLLCINTNRENCYVIRRDNGRYIFLDAGMSREKMQRAVIKNWGMGVWGKTDFVLVTHSHGDHSAAVDKLTEIGVPVYGPGEVKMLNPLQAGVAIMLGDAGVMPLNVQHDRGITCFAYVLNVDGKNILYATDLTTLEVWVLPHFDLALVECNWSDKKLRESDKHYIVKDRIRKTHMKDENLFKGIFERKFISADKYLFCHMGSVDRKNMPWPDSCGWVKPGRVYHI